MTPTAAARSSSLALAKSMPMWVWLGALVVVSTVVRIDLGRGIVAPWIMVDEIIWSELAKSFATSGHFLVRGHSAGFGYVYPVLISPAYRLFGPVPDAYAAAKAINSVIMSLAAVPAYFLARQVVSEWSSLACGVLTVAVPSMVYTGTLTTENAFYPLFLCTALALVLVLQRPTSGRVLALLALSGLAFETRAQAVALLPAILSAPIFLAWLNRDGLRAVREYVSLYSLAGAGVAIVLLLEVVRGRSPFAVFGNYESAAKSHYSLGSVARWFMYHVAELDLYVGVIPFAGFLALVVLAPRLPPPVRAFVAAALALSFWLVLEVGAFASRPDVARIMDRYTFYLAPLFFIALFVLIESRTSRSGFAPVLAAVFAAALPGIIPFSKVIVGPTVSDTLALVPWWNLQDRHVQVRALAVGASIAAAAIFVLIPRRFVFALPALVLVYFAAIHVPIETGPHSVREISRRSLVAGVGIGPRDWIDRAVGREADVTLIWSSVNSPFTIWENEFFNRSVGRVYELGNAPLGGLPESKARVYEPGGLIRDDQGLSIHAAYVLTDASVPLAGRLVAENGGARLRLYRVRGAVRSP